MEESPLVLWFLLESCTYVSVVQLVLLLPEIIIMYTMQQMEEHTNARGLLIQPNNAWLSGHWSTSYSKPFGSLSAQYFISVTISIIVMIKQDKL